LGMPCCIIFSIFYDFAEFMILLKNFRLNSVKLAEKSSKIYKKK